MLAEPNFEVEPGEVCAFDGDSGAAVDGEGAADAWLVGEG